MEDRKATYRAIECYWTMCVAAGDWIEAHELAKEQFREELAKDRGNRDYDRMIRWAERFDNAGNKVASIA